MGTGNALRATETFTLIQLEEERQKLKKKELLKSMLTDSEFSIKGQCAINLMMTKLDIINTFLLMKYKRNFIQMKTWQLFPEGEAGRIFLRRRRTERPFFPQGKGHFHRKPEQLDGWRSGFPHSLLLVHRRVRRHVAYLQERAV